MAVIPTSFGIYGTCVSIDAFQLNRKSIYIAAKQPIRATSVITLDSRLDRSITPEHSSSLFTELLEYMFDGKIKERMKQERGEYLVIDLIEERFKFFRVNQKTLFLDSSYCQQANVWEKLKNAGYVLEEVDHSDLSKEQITTAFKNFCEFIRTLYPENKIVINEVYLVDKYIDKEAQVHRYEGEWDKYIIEKSNNLFPFLYSLLKEYLPGARVVQLPEWNIGDADHYHLCTPAHFVPKTYEYIYSELKSIVLKDYGEQRKKGLVRFQFIGQPIYSREELSKYGIPEESINWLIDISRNVDLKGKTVLQVGGAPISKAVTRKLEVKKWVYLSGTNTNLLSECGDFYDFEGRYVSPKIYLKVNNYIAYKGRIVDLNFDFADMFDVVISKNELEFVSNFECYFDNIYKCLTTNGKYFDRAGKIWCSADGGKWWINAKHNHTKRKEMPVFPHLLGEYEKILNYLNKEYPYRFGENGTFSLAEREILANQIIDGREGLNQFFYEDYCDKLKNSLFTKKSIRPIFKYEVEKEILEKLEEKYQPYKTFEYKSLDIYCEK